MKIAITKLFVIVVCFVCSLSSCVTNKQTDLLQDIKLPQSGITVLPEEYKIIAGDQLTIWVYAWDTETATLFSSYTPSFVRDGLIESTTVAVGQQIKRLDNSGGVKPINVYADGTINFPYIGKVYVAGFTVKEIREILSKKLGEFKEGTVADVTLANRYFSILGEAGADRISMTTTSMTIYQALSIATSIGPYGDRSKVTIIRQTADGSISRTFDIRSKEIIDTDFYHIQPNDVIYIPEMKRKFLGSTTSFAGVFGLITSIAGVVVFTLRVF